LYLSTTQEAHNNIAYREENYGRDATLFRVNNNKESESRILKDFTVTFWKMPADAGISLPVTSHATPTCTGIHGR